MGHRGGHKRRLIKLRKGGCEMNNLTLRDLGINNTVEFRTSALPLASGVEHAAFRKLNIKI